jgi:DNA invertase Pin-like site-specific DNA recombinase
MLDHLRPGQDEVVVWKLDRLGRNTRNLLALIDDLESREIHFRLLTEGISTTAAKVIDIYGFGAAYYR